MADFASKAENQTEPNMPGATSDSAMSSILPYLRLIRLPNVFTAISDVMMGFLFTGIVVPASGLLFAIIVLASSLMYMAGMVLNDLFDIEQDRRERPFRPLPSGRITIRQASILGWGMLVTGVVLGVVSDGVWSGGRKGWGAVSLVAVVLAICIVLYDRFVKKSLVGPWVMGACRTANVLFGMSAGAMTVPTNEKWWNVDAAGLVIAVGIGVYVAGVTWFARREASDSPRPMLIWGALVMALGIGLLGVFPYFGEFAAGTRQVTLNSPLAWPTLLAVLVVTIFRRAMFAILAPSPRSVQVTVKQCITSIIMLDAGVCLATSETVGWSVAIVALMLPMVVLGRWIYST